MQRLSPIPMPALSRAFGSGVSIHREGRKAISRADGRRRRAGAVISVAPLMLLGNVAFGGIFYLPASWLRKGRGPWFTPLSSVALSVTVFGLGRLAHAAGRLLGKTAPP